MSHSRAACLNLAVFCLQLLSTPIIIGYVWSLMWGCALLALTGESVLFAWSPELGSGLWSGEGEVL